MFWADRIAQDLKDKGPQHVDDMFTPSGPAHVGSLRGMVIHDVAFRALKDKGVKTVFTYVYNDLDPMDGMPAGIDPSFEKYMGMPLSRIPSPQPGFKSFAEYFASNFTDILTKLGCKPELVSSAALYESGKMNEVIIEALNNNSQIRKIYEDVAHAKKDDDWYPIQVICPKCGKIGTTKVYKFDGKNVHFMCLENLVKWAKGCGFKGETSPLNGNAKLLWKVDWPAHWKTLGVTVEGAGKDHTSAGGSRDMANAMCKTVFNYPIPYDIPYEHFLIGGKKMSKSKGLGLRAEDILKLFPPEIARFIYLRLNPAKAINFDLTKDFIERIYNDYDKYLETYFDPEGDPEIKRIIELSQIDGKPKKEKFASFGEVLTVLQNPSLKEKLKRPEVLARVHYIKYWLDNFAQDRKLQVLDILPEEAKNLSEKQKEYLKELLTVLERTSKPEDLEKEMYDISKRLEIPSKESFAAIYLPLFGKPFGPKASYLLLELDREILKARYMQAIGLA